MNISGHSLKDHVWLLTPLFALITAIWALRMVCYAAHCPAWLLRSVSVTMGVAVCVLLASILIHVRRFGSYANVVLATFLLVAWAHILIVAAIVFAVLTGTDNVFTLPEYSFPGPDPYHLRHIRGHLTIGLGATVLLGSAMGCLLLFLLRLLLPRKDR
ncbi:MAG TPA: hypothetical protein VGK99_05240 [Acidobacteriota bacterium]|jgi:hypothetical protein